MRPSVVFSLLLVLVPPGASSPVIEGRVTLSAGHKLWYKVIRPSLLEEGPPPLLVCHGGPQVPSDYLFDLEGVDSNRACIFFDQLGCGRSDTPAADSGAYGLEASIDDLRSVISTLGLKRYHLYVSRIASRPCYVRMSVCSNLNFRRARAGVGFSRFST